MYTVGIDISNRKSTVTILEKSGLTDAPKIVEKPFDVQHNGQELNELVERVKLLPGDVRAVMEATGHYHEQMAQTLHNSGIFVSVVNPIAIKKHNAKIHPNKTDKIDAKMIAEYGISEWCELREYTSEDELRRTLKLINRQYNAYCKLKTMPYNQLVALIDQTFPGVNKLFLSTSRVSDGHDKWVDFIIKFPHCEAVSKLSRKNFKGKYLRWCEKNNYHYREAKADEIYDYAASCVSSLPNSPEMTSLIITSANFLNSLNEVTERLRKQMTELAQQLPEYETVINMYGVGRITAPQLIAEIGDVMRFEKRTSITCFAGLDTPSCESGTFYKKSRRISKRGSPHLRKVLFQIITIILQTKPQNDPVYQFLDKKRSEGRPYKVYMIAAAHKFLRIYYAKVKEAMLDK